MGGKNCEIGPISIKTLIYVLKKKMEWLWIPLAKVKNLDSSEQIIRKGLPHSHLKKLVLISPKISIQNTRLLFSQLIESEYESIQEICLNGINLNDEVAFKNLMELLRNQTKIS